jgi:hypothetical protein
MLGENMVPVLNNENDPTVKGKKYCYMGPRFSYSMTCNAAKTNLNVKWKARFH